jgi:glycosyltransferase involved in cell wall biosynthesis
MRAMPLDMYKPTVPAARDQIPVRRLKAFVLLPYKLFIDQWEESYVRGEVPDKTPYGYHLAENAELSVQLSRSVQDRSSLVRLFRRITQKVLGFDLLHAWQQRKEIQASDVVWTHTEKEHLAIALLFALMRKPHPKLIAQSVWLFDNWHDFSWLRKAFYKRLLRRASILTVHSPDNRSIAESLGVPVACRLVHFGVSIDAFPILLRDEIRFGEPVRVLTLGNDRDRDWHAFVEAVSGNTAFDARVVSGNFPSEMARESISVCQGDLRQVRAFYDWADVVVVPLRHNHHVSGLTVILEATACGRPVVVTDTGGLRAYFDDGEVSYVPAGDPGAIREALLRLARDPELCKQRISAAQKRVLDDRYTSAGFAERHRELSHELCGVA